MFKICAISGLSGSGKTTLAKEFVLRNPDWGWIDQDRFYLEQKPTITLSNGDTVPNWDCLEAIDWKAFNAEVRAVASKRGVIVTGFALWDSLLEFNLDYHVHLCYSTNKEKIIERCLEARHHSKGYTGAKAKRDELMVKEVVYPFYLATLENTTLVNGKSSILEVFNREKRVNLIEVIEALFL